MVNWRQVKDEKKILRKGNEKGIDEEKVENMTETSKAGMEREEKYHEDEIKKERTNFINNRKQKRKEKLRRRRISEGE